MRRGLSIDCGVWVPAFAGDDGKRSRPPWRYQCDISTGTVIDSRMPRVAPPSTNSRRREWP